MALPSLIHMCQKLCEGLRGAELRKNLQVNFTSSGVSEVYKKAKDLGLIPKKNQGLCDVVYLIALAKKLSWNEQDSEMIRAACYGRPLPQPSRMATAEEILATVNFLRSKDFLRLFGMKAVNLNVFWYAVGHLFPGAGYLPNEEVSREGVLAQLGIPIGGALLENESDFVILEEVRGSGSTG